MTENENFPSKTGDEDLLAMREWLATQVRVLERLVRYLLSHHDASATLEADDPEAFAAYLRITDDAR